MDNQQQQPPQPFSPRDTELIDQNTDWTKYHKRKIQENDEFIKALTNQSDDLKLDFIKQFDEQYKKNYQEAKQRFDQINQYDEDWVIQHDDLINKCKRDFLERYELSTKQKQTEWMEQFKKWSERCKQWIQEQKNPHECEQQIKNWEQELLEEYKKRKEYQDDLISQHKNMIQQHVITTITQIQQHILKQQQDLRFQKYEESVKNKLVLKPLT